MAGSDDNLLWNAYSVSAEGGASDLLQLTNFSPDSAGNLGCPIIFDNMVPIAMSVGGSLALPCSLPEIDVVSPTGKLAASYVLSFDDRRHQPSVYAPTWSPDGRRVAFVETTVDSATNFSLVGLAVKVMNADDGEVTTIVSVDVHGDSIYDGYWGWNNFSLCWMPDGSRLVFNVPEQPLVSHIWVVGVDGSGLAELTSAPGVWDRSVSCAR